MPTWLFASWKARSIQKRCACIFASLVTLVSGAALLKLYLIVTGELISRRTIKCQQRATELFLSHSHTRRCSTSTTKSPLVVPLKVFFRQADAGLRLTHLRASSACALL